MRIYVFAWLRKFDFMKSTNATTNICFDTLKSFWGVQTYPCGMLSPFNSKRKPSPVWFRLVKVSLWIWFPYEIHVRKGFCHSERAWARRGGASEIPICVVGWGWGGGFTRPHVGRWVTLEQACTPLVTYSYYQQMRCTSPIQATTLSEQLQYIGVTKVSCNLGMGDGGGAEEIQDVAE